ARGLWPALGTAHSGALRQAPQRIERLLCVRPRTVWSSTVAPGRAAEVGAGRARAARSRRGQCVLGSAIPRRGPGVSLWGLHLNGDRERRVLPDFDGAVPMSQQGG